MRFRLTSIITKTGDKGTTVLGSGNRVSKGSDHVMAIGLLRLYVDDKSFLEKLIIIQYQLLVAGSQIAGLGRSSLR